MKIVFWLSRACPIQNDKNPQAPAISASAWGPFAFKVNFLGLEVIVGSLKELQKEVDDFVMKNGLICSTDIRLLAIRAW